MQTLTLTLADTGRSLTVAPGTRIVLSLQEAATTGYAWHGPFIEGTGISAGAGSYLPPDNRAPGAAGLRVITLTATGPGHATVSARLLRTWETGAAPARAFSVSIAVR